MGILAALAGLICGGAGFGLILALVKRA